VVVSVQNSALMQLTNEDGTFSFENVPAGNILVLIHSQGFQDGLYRSNHRWQHAGFRHDNARGRPIYRTTK
jgi:hypothetical protein